MSQFLNLNSEQNNVYDLSKDIPVLLDGKFYTNVKQTSNSNFEVTVYNQEFKDGELLTTIVGVRNEEGEFFVTADNDSWKNNSDIINAISKNQTEKLKDDFSLTAEQKGFYNIATGNNNTAEDGEVIGENEDGEIDIERGGTVLNETEISDGDNARRKRYENLAYPIALKSERNRQDRIKFTQEFVTKTEISLTGSLERRNPFKRQRTKIDGSVILPITEGIADQTGVDWRGGQLNPIAGLAAQGAVDIFNRAGEGGSILGAFETAKDELRKTLAEKDTGFRDALNIYLAQKATGAQGLLSRATGAILNPNLELLFGGPKLRDFGFTFKLSPRDPDEARQVKKIIRFFKQGMSVKTSQTNVFLKTPNTFNINYEIFSPNTNSFIDHPSINRIKRCALLNCVVQYTPDGSYMTYDDPAKTMTSYQLTLSFSELEPIYDEDYTDLDRGGSRRGLNDSAAETGLPNNDSAGIGF
tara:strand:+ start:16483 stop:17895 length:1413 start_codon:yes stop_codon:yes gene_type:complete